MIQFNFTRAEDGTETIVLIGDEGVRIVSNSHANFNRIKEAILNDELDNVFALADAAEVVSETLTRLSDRVILKGDSVYFDGDRMDSILTQHIVDMIRGEDDNWVGYVAFLENVSTNPSADSRESLFAFLRKHDLVITEDGCFIGYKGISLDGKSVSSGDEDVTVTLPDGTVEVHRGRIPNPVGAVIEMPRSLVDTDRDVACSVGLHIGNYAYASTFGKRFLTVKVNPRDVVSVPVDSNDQKIRAHRYTILEDNESKTHYDFTSYVEEENEDESDTDW